MMMSRLILRWIWNILSAILVLQPRISETAHILGIFTTNSRSHQAIHNPIVRGLAARGHNVTVISHFRSEVPIVNYTEILLQDRLPSYIDSIPIPEIPRFRSVGKIIEAIPRIDENSCIEVLTLDYIKQVLHSKDTIVNLIIAECFYSQCFNLLASQLNVPLILVSTVSIVNGPDWMIGKPNNPAYAPVYSSSLTAKMDFVERMINTFSYVRFYYAHYWYFNNNLEHVAREYLNAEPPSIDVLQRQTSLVFYNNHFSFVNSPSVPNSIDIGGIHMNEPKPLPNDIQKFVDDAKHGVLLFSFGTTIKASSLPPAKLNIINRTFSKIPQKVLWRIDDPNAVIEVPNNVKMASWFPQRDLLEHKNVRAFISHCGISGVFEAISTGTPVIAMPMLYDQFQNAQTLLKKKVAVYVDYDTLTVNTLLSAINEIINDTQYYENMKTLSKIFTDRPMSPLDTAMYWSEYILKHNGAPHLRSQAADMPLYQYLLLDVIAFVLFTLVLVLWLSKIAFCSLVAYCCRTEINRKLKHS